MYKLIDTFNDRVISRHRTLKAAVKAEVLHNRAVKRANGQNSYIPTKITDPDGSDVDRASNEFARAQYDVSVRV